MGLFRKAERWRRKSAPRAEDNINVSTPSGGAFAREYGAQSSSSVVTSPTIGNPSLHESEGMKLPEHECLLIGIDFGTTYSGVAWAYSKQPDDIKIVTDWDCIEFQNSDKGKAPTRITYSQPRHDSSVDVPKDGGGVGAHSAQIAWGYGIENDDAAEWFKLLLLDDGDMADGKKDSAQIKKAKSVLQRAGKTPVQAVGDYLRLLWNHALSNIEKEFGAAAVKELRLQVVCTVPAVWTTQAVDRMRQAAHEAGILSYRAAGQTTLQFVSEPEAAALATLEDLKARPNFNKGDTFVVCDAGGGTVDLISYKVIATDPMVLAECVEGSGGLCGAVFLDQDFEALMEQLLGDAWDVPEQALKDMMNAQWENGIKRAFEGQSKNWVVRLPYECVERGAPAVITLNQGHIREIFDNVVSQIQQLVNDQITAIWETDAKLPKAIVLVGGFGSCRYLYKMLKLENEHRGIDVYQSHGMKPWTSISRGAVLKALTNSLMPGPVVQSRILRCSYGTAYHAVWNDKVHDERDKVWYGVTGEYCAMFQMRWYLKKGDKIRDSLPYSNPMEDHVKLPSSQPSSTSPNTNTNTNAPSSPSTKPLPPPPLTHHSISVALYSCALPVPPSRRDPAIVHRASTVRTASPLDISPLPTFSAPNGARYTRVPFTITMQVIGVAIEVGIWFFGKKVGGAGFRAEVESCVEVGEGRGFGGVGRDWNCVGGEVASVCGAEGVDGEGREERGEVGEVGGGGGGGERRRRGDGVVEQRG